MIRGRSLLAGCFGLLLWPVLAQGAEWPQFRGPQSSGVVESAIPAQWGPDKNVQWKVKIEGVAWSSPIVWGNKIFLTTASSDKQTKPQAGGGFGRGGFGGGPGRGGFGGGPGRGGPPQPGQILPPFLRDRLNLAADQKARADQLQKEVDAKLAALLTDAQKKDLKEPPEDGPRPGRGRFRGFPQPGAILPTPLQEQLKLTADQKKQLEQLQKEVDGKLKAILNEEQNKQLADVREAFGRGGFGGPGGPGGPGGRGRGGRGGRGGMGGGGGMNGSIPNAVFRWEVLCVDRETGKVLWKQLAREGKPRIPIQQSNTYATETPVTDGQRVYAYFGMHGLYCYDVDGKPLWHKDLGAYPTMMGQGPASSPVLDGERLFLQIDNEEESFLLALNAKTGDELWRIPRDERTNHSSPVVWKNKVRIELVASGSRKVRSYDPANGKLLWEMSMGGGRCYSTPVGDADLLFVGSEPGFGMGGGGRRGGGGGGGGGRGGAQGGEGGGGGGRGEGSRGGGGLYAVKAGASGDISLKDEETSNAGVAWSKSNGGPEKASPLVYEGHVYLLRNNGGILTCLDAKTGEQIYRQRIQGAASFWASPWAADGKIFCLDDAGMTYVLDAGPQFKVLATNKLNEMFWASAAVSGDSIVLRGVDHLYCIRTKDEKK